jgi:outer membrane protein
MGIEIDQAFKIPASIPLQASFSFQNLKQQALAQNPDLKADDLQKRIARQNLEASQSGNYPEIGLNIGYNFRQTASEAGFVSESQQHGLDYGLFLNYDLFDGFNNRRRTENARIQIAKAKLDQQQTRQELLANLHQVYTSYRASRSRVELEEDNVEVSKETLKIAQANYQAGGIDYVQLQEAQQAYLKAKERLITARYETKQAEIKLMRLSGMLLNNEGQD